VVLAVELDELDSGLTSGGVTDPPVDAAVVVAGNMPEEPYRG